MKMQVKASDAMGICVHRPVEVPLLLCLESTRSPTHVRRAVKDGAITKVIFVIGHRTRAAGVSDGDGVRNGAWHMLRHFAAGE